MRVTAIGSQSPGGENTVSSAASEATGATNFLEILLEGSSPTETQNANQAAGPVTGKLLSLLPDVEQGTETDHMVTTADSGVHGLVPAEATALMPGVAVPGADTRASGTSVAVSTSVADAEGPGPSHPITALPSHVLGSDPAAPGAPLLTASAAGGAPAGAAAPMTPVAGAAPLVSLAHGLEPAMTAPAPASPPAATSAPLATPVPAAAPVAAGAGNVANDVVRTAPGVLLPADALALVADAAPVATSPVSQAATPPAVAPPAAPAVAPAAVPAAAEAVPVPGPHAPPAASPDAPAAVPVLGPPASVVSPGQAPTTPLGAPYSAMDIVRQVADALQVSIRRGEDVLRMQMRPAELGTVVIHLVQRDGQLHAHVRADSPESVHALEQALSGLADTLQSQGQSLGGLDVALRQAHEERALFAQMRGMRAGAAGDEQPPSMATSPSPTSPTPTSAIDLRA